MTMVLLAFWAGRAEFRTLLWPLLWLASWYLFSPYYHGCSHDFSVKLVPTEFDMFCGLEGFVVLLAYSDSSPLPCFSTPDCFYTIQTAEYSEASRHHSCMCFIFQSPKAYTLSELWRTKGRIFCIYHNPIARCFPKYLWGDCAITCPWPNVVDRKVLISYLDVKYGSSPGSACIFYGTQGILTPRTSTILRHPMGSLREFTGLATSRAFLSWIRSKEQNNWYNIVIADFVELDNFTENIIALNYSKEPPRICHAPLAGATPVESETEDSEWKCSGQKPLWFVCDWRRIGSSSYSLLATFWSRFVDRRIWCWIPVPKCTPVMFIRYPTI